MENNDSSLFGNDDNQRYRKDKFLANPPTESSKKTKLPVDSWSKIADELDAAANSNHSDWSGEDSRFSSKTRSSKDCFVGGVVDSDGLERSGKRAPNSVISNSESPFEDRRKIDEDYETRSKNRTRSVWNHGEWIESEQVGNRPYQATNGRSPEVNASLADDYRRPEYRRDNRESRGACSRQSARRERGTYDQGEGVPGRKSSPEINSYRESGFRGGRREFKQGAGARREGTFRNDGYRNDAQIPTDRENGRYADRRDFRRFPNERQRRYNNDSTDRAQQNEDYRFANRRGYRMPGRNDYPDDRYRNSYKDNFYVGSQRRRPRYGRSTTLEPTIGALGKRGEPLSLAEELAARRNRHSLLEKYNSLNRQKDNELGVDETVRNHNLVESKVQDSISYGDRMPLGIIELEKLTMQELVAEARRQNLETIEGEQKRDLIVRVLRAKIQRNGMMFGEGTLEILPDEFGFLRSSKARYLSCPDDIYISPSQIRRFGLRNGLTISGQIRPPKERERYFALLCVESINGENPNALASKPFFDDLVDARPIKQLKLESLNVDPDLNKTEPETFEASARQKRRALSNLRAIDLVAPFALGQRALLIYPECSEKTALLREIIKSIAKSNDESSVFVVLIDQRPEEIKEMEEALSETRCEVVGSSFDETPIRHIQLSEIVFEKAKRMVEYGQNVVVVLDSLTRLARAWNAERASSDISAGLLDPISLQRPKKLFSSARYIEGGGSLTIVATASIEDNNYFDQATLEEFRSVENVEIWLDQVSHDEASSISVNVVKSHARDVRDFIPQENYGSYCKLLERLKGVSPEDAKQFLAKIIEETPNNSELYAFLKSQDGVPV